MVRTQPETVMWMAAKASTHSSRASRREPKLWIHSVGERPHSLFEVLPVSNLLSVICSRRLLAKSLFRGLVLEWGQGSFAPYLVLLDRRQNLVADFCLSIRRSDPAFCQGSEASWPCKKTAWSCLTRQKGSGSPAKPHACPALSMTFQRSGVGSTTARPCDSAYM